jgi:hypothetical protein
VHSRCAAAAWVACPPPRPPKGVHLQGGDPRCPVGQGPPPHSQQAPDPPDRNSGRYPHGRYWAYPPGVLGADSCLAPSLPRTPSDTLIRPTAAQAEKLCSPLHRLGGDRRSHRPLSLGSSSPVGTARPHRCPECSARAESTLAEEPEYVRGSSPEPPPSGVLAPAGRSALPPLWRRAGAPMFSPAMTRSPIPQPVSATLGRHHPGIGALSQDRSCCSAARISVTGKVGRLSMGVESSYSILWSDARPAPKSSRYFRSSR